MRDLTYDDIEDVIELVRDNAPASRQLNTIIILAYQRDDQIAEIVRLRVALENILSVTKNNRLSLGEAFSEMSIIASEALSGKGEM